MSADAGTNSDPDGNSDPGTNGGFDWLSLDRDETVLWGDTPHQYSLVPALIVGIPLSIVVVGLFVIAGAYLSHVNTNYVVTSAALYKKTGILSRNVQRIEFDKVQDTSYRQSALGTYFGYGTVDVSTAGGSGVEMSFRNVAYPQELQTLVNERLRGRDRNAEGTDDRSTVLDEILAELRALRDVLEEGVPQSDASDLSDPSAASDQSAADPSNANSGATESPRGNREGETAAETTQRTTDDGA